MYKAIDEFPPIINTESFKKVQEEKERRSNIEISADGTKKRKATHYSSKKNIQANQDNTDAE